MELAEKRKIDTMWEMFTHLIRYAGKELHECKTIKDLKQSDTVQLMEAFYFDGIEGEDPATPFDNYAADELPPESCDDYEWDLITFDTGFCGYLRFDYCKSEDLFYLHECEDRTNERVEDFMWLYGTDDMDKDAREYIKQRATDALEAITHGRLIL